MLDKLKSLVKKDKDLPERAYTTDWREQFRTGAIYQNLKHAFHDEKDTQGEYIRLSERRPSVQFGLPTIIVNETTSLLFSEGHFPAIEIEADEDGDGEDDGRPEPVKAEPGKPVQPKPATPAERDRKRRNRLLASLVKDTKLKSIMLDASVRGSVGSIAIKLEVLRSRVFWKVMSTQFLTPEWDKEAPDQLAKVTEKYKVKGKALIALGYNINERDKEADFWFQRVWDHDREIWYLPWPVLRLDTAGQKHNYPDGPTEDLAPGRTMAHGFGFVPMVWIKNLPGGDGVDGACTFEAALKNAIEIDYQLSQSGRGLKYSSDPTLVIKEAGGDVSDELVLGAANAIRMDKDSDAKLLEISGSAATAVLEYVKALREFSLELCGGNRVSPEKMATAQSGKAMEMMNAALIFLADKLRTAYGEDGLVPMLKMVIRANATRDLIIRGKKVAKGALGDPEVTQINLKWPPWYAPTAADHQSLSTAIKTYRDAGVLSQESGIAMIQHDFDVDDPVAEKARIDGEADLQAEREAKTAVPPAGKKPLASAA